MSAPSQRVASAPADAALVQPDHHRGLLAYRNGRRRDACDIVWHPGGLISHSGGGDRWPAMPVAVHCRR